MRGLPEARIDEVLAIVDLAGRSIWKQVSEGEPSTDRERNILEPSGRYEHPLFMIQFIEAVAVSALLIPSSPAADKAPTCDGWVVTVAGTQGEDVLIGTQGPDVIAGLAGYDEIHGRGGDDVICGEKGWDTISGGAGDDRLSGDLGHDAIYGGRGDDRIELGGDYGWRNGQDNAWGGPGRDRLIGDSGPNLLAGGRGHDLIEGFGADFDDCDCETGFDEILKGGGLTIV